MSLARRQTECSPLASLEEQKGTLQPPISRESAGSAGCFSEGTRHARLCQLCPSILVGQPGSPPAKSGTATAKARDKCGEKDRLVEGECLQDLLAGGSHQTVFLAGTRFARSEGLVSPGWCKLGCSLGGWVGVLGSAQPL